MVPRFVNVDAGRYKDNPNTIIARADIEGACVLPWQVGFIAVDESGKRIESWRDGVHHFDATGTVKLDMADVPNSAMTVYPIVRYGDIKLVASPSVVITPFYNVITNEATDITESSVVLRGKIENVGENDDYTCGFYWSKSHDIVGMDNSNYISGEADSLGGLTALLDGLEPETIYSFRACATINGKKILSDNTQSFKTKEAMSDPLPTDSINSGLLKDYSIEYWKPYVTPFSVYILIPENSFSSYNPEMIQIDAATNPNEFLGSGEYYACKSVGYLLPCHMYGKLGCHSVLESNSSYYMKFIYDRLNDKDLDSSKPRFIDLSHTFKVVTPNINDVKVHTPDEYKISQDTPGLYRIHFGIPDIENFGITGEQYIFFGSCWSGDRTLEIEISTDPSFNNIFTYAWPESFFDNDRLKIDISTQIGEEYRTLYYRTHFSISSPWENIFCENVDRENHKDYDFYGETKSFTIPE